MDNKKNGFTLIELLVVIAIIGILSTIVAVSVSAARAKGRDAQRVAQIREVRVALEVFAPPGSSYPTTAGAWNNSITQGLAWIPTTDSSLKKLAVPDPLNTTSGEYAYYYISDGNNYCIQLSQEGDCSASPYYAGVSSGSCKLRLGSSASYCTSAPSTSGGGGGGGGGGGPPPVQPLF